MSGPELIINRLTLIVAAVTVVLAPANAASEADHATLGALRQHNDQRHAYFGARSGRNGEGLRLAIGTKWCERVHPRP